MGIREQLCSSHSLAMQLKIFGWIILLIGTFIGSTMVGMGVTAGGSFQAIVNDPLLRISAGDFTAPAAQIFWGFMSILLGFSYFLFFLLPSAISKRLLVLEQSSREANRLASEALKTLEHLKKDNSPKTESIEPSTIQ